MRLSQALNAPHLVLKLALLTALCAIFMPIADASGQERIAQAADAPKAAKTKPADGKPATNAATSQKTGPSAGKPPASPAPAAEEKPSPDEQARVEYNKGVELFQIAQIQKDKGNADGQKKLLREAIKRFELALTHNPKLTEAQSNIGFAWLTLGDNRRAIVAFEKALTLNPNHLNTLNGLATAYAFLGRTDQAIATFDRLTTLDPANSQFFFNKGSVLQKAGRLDEARASYEQALKINPGDQRALFNMGTLLENQGRLEEARPWYEKAKGVEIGNTIGLEAIRRLEAIDAALKAPPGKSPK